MQISRFYRNNLSARSSVQYCMLDEKSVFRMNLRAKEVKIILHRNRYYFHKINRFLLVFQHLL